MKITIIIISVILFSQLNAQNYSNEWVDLYLNFNEKEFTDYYNKVSELDFSNLWLNEKYQEKFIGFIGSNYQRIHIHLDSIRNDKKNRYIYHVEGQSKVKNNRTPFTGTIKIVHSKIFEPAYDNMKRGFIIASYEFKEVPSGTHYGNFLGVTSLKWYINDKGELCYDNLDIENDNYYSNCEFVGVWKNEIDNTELICNFGQYRIPYAMDLDVGVENFYPAKEFIENGWNDYMEGTNEGKQNMKWWH